jgi:hypothetical protein
MGTWFYIVFNSVLLVINLGHHQIIYGFIALFVIGNWVIIHGLRVLLFAISR